MQGPLVRTWLGGCCHRAPVGGNPSKLLPQVPQPHLSPELETLPLEMQAAPRTSLRGLNRRGLGPQEASEFVNNLPSLLCFLQKSRGWDYRLRGMDLRQCE